jgi:hypothetical protein
MDILMGFRWQKYGKEATMKYALKCQKQELHQGIRCLLFIPITICLGIITFYTFGFLSDISGILSSFLVSITILSSLFMAIAPVVHLEYYSYFKQWRIDFREVATVY